MQSLVLSENQIENVDILKGFTYLNDLFLSNNKISAEIFPFLNRFKDLEKVMISFNKNLTLKKDEKFIEIPKRLTQLYLDQDLIGMFDQPVNFRVNKNKNKYTFLTTLYLITENDLEFIDCDLTLDYIERNIHLNLFFDFQVSLFLEKCRFKDMEF